MLDCGAKVDNTAKMDTKQERMARDNYHALASIPTVRTAGTINLIRVMYRVEDFV
jgi:hypothetical protein